MNRTADPTRFNRLLELIQEHRIGVHFEAGYLYYDRLPEGEEQTEFLELARLFRKALEVAYGPDTLPVPTVKTGRTETMQKVRHEPERMAERRPLPRQRTGIERPAQSTHIVARASGQDH